MSYQSWHIYGYGLCVSDIKDVNVERIQALLAKAPEYQKSIQEWLEECELSEPTVEDYLDFDQDYCLGLATILKEVIFEAEHIEFTACDDYGAMKYLLFCPLYPWQLADHERCLTPERIAEILSRYVSILTDSPPEIDYQSVENGG